MAGGGGEKCLWSLLDNIKLEIFTCGLIHFPVYVNRNTDLPKPTATGVLHNSPIMMIYLLSVGISEWSKV